MTRHRVSLASFLGACALVLACGEALEPAVGYDTRLVTEAVSRPDDAGKRPDAAPGAHDGTCPLAGARCAVFEPGGPERWGCYTTGTVPELACEHAAGASIARCNCSGAFGERPPDAPGDVVWFDVPATSTPFAEKDVVQLWSASCHGRCAPPPPPVPHPGPDAG